MTNGRYSYIAMKVGYIENYIKVRQLEENHSISLADRVKRSKIIKTGYVVKAYMVDTVDQRKDLG
jgi:hypothetical protein